MLHSRRRSPRSPDQLCRRTLADLDFFQRPQLDHTILITAFSGWSDAAESATRAAKFVIRSLKATRFAAIDPEEFFDFTQLRPDVSIGSQGHRVLAWPKNQFYSWQPDDPSARGIVVIVGAEPHLRWKRFASLVMEVATACNVELMVSLGALLDAVPHTRPAPVTCSATSPTLGEGLELIRFGPSTYQGPTGVISVLVDAMNRRGIPAASLWGHAPHYLQVRPNPRVTLALLQSLQPFMPRPMQLDDLEDAVADFDKNVGRSLNEQAEIREYVTQLEEKYDSEGASRGVTNIPGEDAERLVAEVEDFLRQAKDNGREGEPPVG